MLKLIPYFDEIIFHHIPREENQLADALSTLSSMFKVKWKNKAPSIKIEHLDEHAYCLATKEEFYDKTWFYDIKRYLEKYEYPENVSILDKKTVRNLSTKFFLSGDMLYKRNYYSVLLKYMDIHEANRIIVEVLEGSFGTHSSGHTTTRKILKVGYDCLTMEVDCYCHVQTCHKFQIYIDKMHIPPTPLNVLTSPWPFAMWGIYLIGHIEPTT